MKICRLHQQGNQDCLLFLAGWGMCPEPFYEIPAGSVDVFMLYDYSSMDNKEISSVLENLQGSLQEKAPYRKIHLLAWSMGIWAAALLFGGKTLSASGGDSPFPIPSALMFTSLTAIGGTCCPVHDKFGIPARNFAEMAEQLSPARVEAFQRSMFADEQEADRFVSAFRRGGRSYKKLHRELLALAAGCTAQPEVPDMYTNRIVTGRDRIVPARNQVRAWGRKQCRTLSLPHFPFYHWPSWSAMLQEFTSVEGIAHVSFSDYAEN